MSELDHDPLLQMILALRADLDELRDQESATPKSGTWTPTFLGTSTAGVFTYNVQSGAYSLIGKIVYFTGRARITAIGTPPVGNMQMGGLPFTCESGFFHPVTFGIVGQFNYSASSIGLTGFVNVSDTTITLRETFDNIADVNVPAANFTNVACDILVSGVYRI